MTVHAVTIVTGSHLNEATLCDVVESIERDDVPGTNGITGNSSEKCLQSDRILCLSSL